MSSRFPPPRIISAINDHEPNPRTLTPPMSLSIRPNKRKKGGSKKQKAIEQKFQTLVENLKPIPFKPLKLLNFTKHEKFLKRLGLWDFVHIQFDLEIRLDLIAQLIANYESRFSYVSGYRVGVNRAELGRAFKLPVKKDKGSALASLPETLDLVSGAVATEESIGFIEDFLSNWLLLHEDTWALPNEVVNLTKVIKDGHPEKVDWAGLVWFMVEKELNQGKELKECYYASHLQYLIRSQREELFGEDNRAEVGAEVKEEENGGEEEIWKELKGEAEVEAKEKEEGSEVKMRQGTKVWTVVEVKKGEDSGEIMTGKEPEVEEGVEVEEEEEGDKVKMGKELVGDALVEMEEEEVDGGKLKMGKERMLEVGMDVEEKDGEIATRKELMLEVGMNVKEEKDGEITTGKELTLEARMDVKEKQDGGDFAMGKELLLEVGMDVKEEQDRVGIAMGKELMVEAMVDVNEEQDGGEIAMGKEPMVKAMVDVKEKETGAKLKLGEEPSVKAGVKVKGKKEIEGGDMRLDGFDDFQVRELEDSVMVEEPNVELTLGKEVAETEEEVKEGDMMNIEGQADEQGQWLLDGKNSMGDHFLQHCKLETNSCLYGHEERKSDEVDEEAEEEEDDDEFNPMSRCNTFDSGVLMGNLLPGTETTQMSFGLIETHGTTGGPSSFGNGIKREIGHEDDMLHKRLKTDGAWSDTSFDFETCVGEMRQWMGKTMMAYQAMEHAFEKSNMNQQFLLSELRNRENATENLQKTKHEEILKKDVEIYRLERELSLMASVLEGYRKSLKETHNAFSEYRQQCQLLEEPLYKDVGLGGLILSTMELEKLRLKREEEERMIFFVIKQKVKEFEEDVSSKIWEKMAAHFNEVLNLDKRLMNSEIELKLLKELSAKHKVSVTSECAPVD